MARELGPQGIHVAHLIIDAGVDTAFVRERIRARGGEEALDNIQPDQLMNPASIAEAYWTLHSQTPRRLDARAGPSTLRRDGGDDERASIFYFDFGSPNAYLAHKVIPAIEQRTGARFKYVPVLLGGIFKATGNRSPAEAFAGIPSKLRLRGPGDRALREAARHHRLRPQPALPGQHAADHARRGGGPAARGLRALRRGRLPRHVGGRAEDGRPGGDRDGADRRRPAGRPADGADPGSRRSRPS